jgi:hypothetical protein
MSFFFIPAFVNNHTRASPAEIDHMRWTSSLTGDTETTDDTETDDGPGYVEKQ